MTTKALRILAGVVLLAGSAALYGMSVADDVPGDGNGRAVHSAGPTTPPAFSITVTTQRALPGRRSSGPRSGSAMRNTAGQSATTAGDGWGELPRNPRG
jgi:hypothetical protein